MSRLCSVTDRATANRLPDRKKSGSDQENLDDKRGISMRFHTLLCTLLLMGLCALKPREAEPLGLKMQGNVLVGVFVGIPPMPLPQSCGQVLCQTGDCGYFPVNANCGPLRQEYPVQCDEAPTCPKSVCRTDEYGYCCGHCYTNCAGSLCFVACPYCSGG